MVQRLDLAVDGRRDLRLGLAQPGQSGTQLLLAAVTLGHGVRVGAPGVRQAAEGVRQAFQLRRARPGSGPGQQSVQRTG